VRWWKLLALPDDSSFIDENENKDEEEDEGGLGATYHIFDGVNLLDAGIHCRDFVVSIITAVVFKIEVDNDGVMSAAHHRDCRDNHILCLQGDKIG
jgi:hypothetical protein